MCRLCMLCWKSTYVLSGQRSHLQLASQRNAGERTLADGAEPGDLGCDPISLLPRDHEEPEEIQIKEILNGRFAMISLAGMVAEELITKEKLHGLDFFLGPS